MGWPNIWLLTSTMDYSTICCGFGRLNGPVSQSHQLHAHWTWASEERYCTGIEFPQTSKWMVVTKKKVQGW